jgi:ribosome-binding factor A
MKQYKRSTRISELLLRDVSEYYNSELNDNSPAMVTFTHVRVSDDLRYATVFYSCLGNENQRNSVNLYLERKKNLIRKEVGKNLHTRYIPEFSFKFDPSIEEGIKIEKLLNDIKYDSKQ